MRGSKTAVLAILFLLAASPLAFASENEAMSSKFAKTKDSIDDAAYLVTDSAAASNDENVVSASSNAKPKTGFLGNGNAAGYFTQQFTSNAWMLVLALSIIVAALLLRGKSSTPYYYTFRSGRMVLVMDPGYG